MENSMKMLLVGSEIFRAEERTVGQKGRIYMSRFKVAFHSFANGHQIEF